MAVRGKMRDEGPLDPNLIPLLDVVLQLITFFMILVHFGTRLEGATLAVRLPVTPAALPGADLTLDRLVAVVDAGGRLLVDDEPLDDEAARAWWAEQAKQRQGGQELLGGPVEELATVVVLRVDRDASYGAVRRMLAEAQRRGFAHFALVVLRRPET